MTGIFLGVAVLAIAVVVFLKFRKRFRHQGIFEKSGLSYFKTLLRQRGIDTARIPDAALSEIIRVKIAAAKKQAAAAAGTDCKPSQKNWRIILVRSLEAEANLMISLMAEGPGRYPASDAAAAFRKHGVFQPAKPTVKSGMTPEQFLEATQRGTLYAELSERQAKRENS